MEDLTNQRRLRTHKGECVVGDIISWQIPSVKHMKAYILNTFRALVIWYDSNGKPHFPAGTTFETSFIAEVPWACWILSTTAADAIRFLSSHLEWSDYFGLTRDLLSWLYTIHLSKINIVTCATPQIGLVEGAFLKFSWLDNLTILSSLRTSFEAKYGFNTRKWTPCDFVLFPAILIQSDPNVTNA